MLTQVYILWTTGRTPSVESVGLTIVKDKSYVTAQSNRCATKICLHTDVNGIHECYTKAELMLTPSTTKIICLTIHEVSDYVCSSELLLLSCSDEVKKCFVKKHRRFQFHDCKSKKMQDTELLLKELWDFQTIALTCCQKSLCIDLTFIPLSR